MSCEWLQFVSHAVSQWNKSHKTNESTALIMMKNHIWSLLMVRMKMNRFDRWKICEIEVDKETTLRTIPTDCTAKLHHLFEYVDDSIALILALGMKKDTIVTLNWESSMNKPLAMCCCCDKERYFTMLELLMLSSWHKKYSNSNETGISCNSWSWIGMLISYWNELLLSLFMG